MSSGMTCSKLPMETIARGLPFCDVVNSSALPSSLPVKARAAENLPKPGRKKERNSRGLPSGNTDICVS